MTPKRFGHFLIIVLSLIFFNHPSIFAAPVRVLILPFQVHSEADLSFLKEGVTMMLATRLTDEGKVLPLGKAETQQALQGLSGPVDEGRAYGLGAQLNVDYVAMGTITVFGDSISTDARFLDVRNRKSVVLFSQFGKTQGDVLYHINLFAAEVNDRVFGRKTLAYRKPDPAPEVDDRRKHPETLLKTDRRGGGGRIGLAESGIWRSRRFKTAVNGVAVADVDGDGNNETVFISERAVHIHRHLNGQFMKVTEIEGRPVDRYISVDAADINGNGLAEIYVTNNLEDRFMLSSFVLEWTGSTFKKIASGEGWYFRVIHMPDEGPVLLGQKRGSNKPSAPLFIN